MKEPKKANQREIFQCLHLLGYITMYIDLLYDNVELYRDWMDGGCDIDYLTDKMDIISRKLNKFWHKRFRYLMSNLSEKDLKDYFTPVVRWGH